MEGYQFGHVESYSRKGGQRKKRANGDVAWKVDEVIDEAERKPGACDHVEEPDTDPLIIAGTCASFDELRAAHDEACAVKLEVPYTDRKTGIETIRQKSIRKDAHTLYASVFSLPVLSADAWAEPQLMDECIDALKQAAEWEADRLRAAGGEFAMAVIHRDESHMHVHIYGIDRIRGTINWLHPGKAAVDRIRRAKSWQDDEVSGQDRAYCNAMRQWQDELHEDVSSLLGLTRIGPGRARLTQAEWKALKAAQKELAKTRRKLKEAKETIANAEHVQESIRAEEKALEEYKATSEEEIANERAALIQGQEELSQGQAALASEQVVLDQRAEKLGQREDAAMTMEREAHHQMTIADNHLDQADEKATVAEGKATEAEVYSYFMEGMTAGTIEYDVDRGRFEPCREPGASLEVIVQAAAPIHEMWGRDSGAATRAAEQYQAWERRIDAQAQAKAEAAVKDKTEYVDAQIAALDGFAANMIVPDTNCEEGYRPKKGVSPEDAEPFLAQIQRRPEAAIKVGKWIMAAWNKVRSKIVAADATLAAVDYVEQGYGVVDLDKNEKGFVAAKGAAPEIADKLLQKMQADPAASGGILRKLFRVLKGAAQARREADMREAELSEALENTRPDRILKFARPFMREAPYLQFKRHLKGISGQARDTLQKSKESKSIEKDDDQR
ncbi:hypothetical protein FDK21_20230 [Cohaesibacter sp. CAU 1516]|uniref:hypothetical protein n=1 Tax=Cohaesibacter sp. CAU 1516 TaxID=2576038 RepID=UPI0010FF1DD7|nr:hypothetical protein [Cohaesibacter sp. CAU 1516]TLP42162.1 hypothetical protein FDK21_20230 [Cohaesibacter sp. CAU 1516]